MKNYDLITPEGTKDLLFGESVVRRKIEDTLLKLFKSRGYSEIITPGLEFFDVFNMKSRYFPQENLYKLTDSKGRLIVMRPESTMPIARVVATRLRDAELPLKLCYNQTIYRNESLLKGRSDETVQAGIELIGSASKRADLEVISTAISVLSSYGDDFSFEIGDSGFFNEIVEKLGVDELVSEEIRRLIEVKNYPALNDLLDGIGNNDATKALKKLPRLFGKEEVFDKALKLFPESTTLGYLKELYTKLCELGFEGKITCDLGIVNRISLGYCVNEVEAVRKARTYYQDADGEYWRAEIEKYMVMVPCPACGGARLKPFPLAVKVGGKNIYEVTLLSIKELHKFAVPNLVSQFFSLILEPNL